MRTFLQRFFQILGVIFFLLLIGGAYLVIADPFEIRALFSMPIVQKPALQNEDATKAESTATVQTSEEPNAHPYLSESQETVLEKVGIDPSQLPVTLTPAQRQCFVSMFGDARVLEIVNGATPTALEVWKGRECLQ